MRFGLFFLAVSLLAEPQLVELENPRVGVLSGLFSAEKQQTSQSNPLSLKIPFESQVVRNTDIISQMQAEKLYLGLFQFRTELGRLYAQNLLQNGTLSSVEELKERQEMIKRWMKDDVERWDLQDSITRLKGFEAELLEFFAGFEPKHSNWWTIFNPYVYASLTVSYVQMTLRAQLHGFWQRQPGFFGFIRSVPRRVGLAFLSLIEIAGAGFNLYEQGKSHLKVKNAHALAVKRVRALQNLLLIHEHPELEELLKDTQSIGFDVDTHLFQVNLIKANRVLAQAREHKDLLWNLVLETARLDFYLAVSDRLAWWPKDLCFVELIEGHTPKLHAEGLWNPMMVPEKSHRNTVSLEGKSKVMLLTGENASGKSTLMRAVGINVLFLAQTLGIASAKSFTLTPFKAVCGFMQTDDILGERSSYEAEVNRVVSAIKMDVQPKLLIADELFSSTNANDALMGSQEILSILEGQEYSAALVSSHLSGLNAKSNFYMDAYRIFPGSNPKTNALELFEQELGL